MNITKKALALVGVALLGSGAFAGNATITLDRVQQRYPWNGLVDIDYTVNLDGADAADYFVKFNVTAQGTNYVMHEMLDAATLINASNGAYRVTWVASAEGADFSDGVKILATNAQFKAQLVYSGSDKSQVPYPYYTVIDISGGSDATSYPVEYEVFANTAAATNKYNTQEYKTNKIVLRKIPAGTFIMGSPEDEVDRNQPTYYNIETQHPVTLTEAYFIGMFPITQKQWENVVGENPAGYGPKGGETEDELAELAARPVENVSPNMLRGDTDIAAISNGIVNATWKDAPTFLHALREKTGLTDLDLPTEAQWEFAARAGTTTSTFFGNNVKNWPATDLAKYLWVAPFALSKTHGVGQVIPNQWGLYDMLGNVWEICLDHVNGPGSDDWGTEAVVDPLRVIKVGANYSAARGGEWLHEVSYARSACRGSSTATGCSNTIGFRLSRHSPIADLHK